MKAHRLASNRETTRRLAASPTLFGEIRQPQSKYLVIPGVSSERRAYVPIGFLPPQVIASNLVNVVPGADLYHFGVLTSQMHMAWVRHVCGRLKSDYRYSNQLVYNNFPWPFSPPPQQRETVEEHARRVLDSRIEHGDGRHGFLPSKKAAPAPATLADLYDPLTMPAPLLKAHQALDRAVDRCYRAEPFPSDRARIEFLFALYERITSPLTATPKPARRTRRPH